MMHEFRLGYKLDQEGGGSVNFHFCLLVRFCLLLLALLCAAFVHITSVLQCYLSVDFHFSSTFFFEGGGLTVPHVF